jgi:GNAT superfamily N-acetyltransferase
VDVPDEPGRLAGLAAAVRGGGGNILTFEVHRRDDGQVTDELVVDLPAARQVAVLVTRLHEAGATAVRAAPADPHELVDLPTHLVEATARLAVDPDALSAVLGLASGAASVTVSLTSEAGTPEIGAADERRLVIRVGGGRVAVLERAWAPFTSTERSRAAAVARAAALLAAVPPRREWVVMLPGNAELTLRPAAPADAAALAAMHARCSAQTLRRYPAELAHPGLLPAVLEGAPGALALVAVEPGGALVALAGLHPLGTRPVGEVTLLVEDGWQGLGVETALVRRLADAGREQGLTELVATVEVPVASALPKVFARAGLPVRRAYDGRLMELRVELADDPRAPTLPGGRAT